MWKIFQCAETGRRHRLGGMNGQDRIFVHHTPEVDAVCLSDGAGSAAYAEEGAELVTRETAMLLTEYFGPLFECNDGGSAKEWLLSKLWKRLETLRQELDCDLWDLSATLLAVAVRGDDYLLLQIGDGVIGYADRKGLRPATDPRHEDAMDTTTFVVSKDVLQRMHLSKGTSADISGFILMSDGSARTLYEEQKGIFHPALLKIAQRMCIGDPDLAEEALREITRRFLLANTVDDCSIALLLRPGGLMCMEALSLYERREIYGFKPNERGLRSKVARLDRMMALLREPRTLGQLSRLSYCQPCYLRRHLERLLRQGLIRREGLRYKAY